MKSPHKKIRNERMHSETSARILIADFDFDPSRITRDLGIKPSKTWQRGQSTVPGALIKHRENGWAFDSKLPKSATIERHAENILAALAPAWEKITSLSKIYYVELSCAVYSFGGDRPELGFEKQIIKQLAEIGARIDIDLYISP